MGKRELVALLNLSSWCLVIVERLFLAVPQGCLQFVIVVFPDHTHYFLWYIVKESRYLLLKRQNDKKTGRVFPLIPLSASHSLFSKIIGKL